MMHDEGVVKIVTREGWGGKDINSWNETVRNNYENC